MAGRGNTYCTKFGRTVKPSLKARENAAIAADYGIESVPDRTPSIARLPPKPGNVVKSEGGKSNVSYEHAKRRLELEHKKKLLELEESELERSIASSVKSEYCRKPLFHARTTPKNSNVNEYDDVANSNFDPHEESVPPQTLTREWIDFHNEFTPGEHSRPKSIVRDWIDSIGTVEEQNTIQRNAMSSNTVVPLMLSGLQEFMIDEFTGDPADWPEWSMDFKNKVHDCVILTTSQKMSILKKSLSDEPKSLIYSLLFDACHYKTALSELRRRYGAPDVVAKAQIEKIRSIDPLRDSSDIVKFRTEVGRLVHIFQSLNMTADLQGQVLLSELVRKLSQGMKESWGNFLRKHGPGVLLMYDWLSQREESLRLGGGMAFGSSNSTKSQKPVKRQMNVVGEKVKLTRSRSLSPSCNSRTPESSQSKKPPTANDKPSVAKCQFCSKAHWIDDCSEFAKKNPENRLQWFKSERSCFRCARKSHGSRDCRSRALCRVCRGRHHVVLHEAFQKPDTLPDKKLSDNHTFHANPDVFLMILPVRIYAQSGLSIDTNCLVDSGSQACFISQKIASSLELKGPKFNLKLSNVAKDIEPMISQKFQIHVCNPDDPAQTCISVNEVWSFRDDFNLPDQIIPRDENGRPKWTHLSDLNIPDIAGKEIGLLLGANCKEALRELNIRKGPDMLPDAVQLPLGWCIRGAANVDCIPESLSTNTCSMALIIENEMSLSKLVESLWSTESFGCKFQNDTDMSMHDRYALEILKKSIKKLPVGQYEVGMLCKPEFHSLPDDTCQSSVAKYHSLRRRLCKSPEMKEKYCAAMNRNIEKGYAQVLSKDEAASKTPKTYTIPHHGVWNPAKQKMRPVFDAATALEGTSLNDHLLSGPDFANNADAVKMRFRMGKIPMSADVEDMFCMVRVPPEDTDALRFIWDPELGPNPKTYKMLVHIFGAKSSPSCVNFAMRQTALDHAHVYPTNAINAILHSMYVDDFLYSANSEEEAVQITHDVISILASGGFKLTKWVSPCPAVLNAATGSKGIISTVNLDLDESPVSRALGQHWDVKRDTFGFKPCILEKPLTKRGLLSEISSIYDPLGFLTPYLIRAKILLQNLWTSKLGWDDEINEEAAKQWRAWLAELPDLEALNIPRKYWPAELDATRISLHVFVDASEKAYCCVCYLRVENDRGDVHVSLVLSRVRVSPVCKKKLTLPRLELQAAVLGVRMGDTIIRELPYEWNCVKFWTDSVTVIQYLSNDSKRLKTFVSNRVAEIRGSSRLSQWSHIPGHLNPADEGTRGLSVNELLSENCRWFSGPLFLWSPEETWPEQPKVLSIPCDDVEVKRTVLTTRKFEITEPLLDCTNFSSMYRLLAVTAWCKRFVYNARKNVADRIFGPLTGEEIRESKLFWIASIQRERFPAEVEAAKLGIRLPNDSSLLPLLPVLENGILRVGGRIDCAAIAHDAKHQMIIPANHSFTTLLILHIHAYLQHAGPGTVMAHSRRNYWIVKCRSQVQKALRQCMDCRNLNAKPTVPKIAPLPPARVIAENPVFHYCGVDYFGPLVIKERRSRVNRWVALFTCLSVRAIHLEVVNTLSTDGFIMAYRRFIARRSEPAEIFCDNGTNFRGAAPELRECVKRLNADEKFRSFMSKREIVFHFNPPQAPHMGGAWERLVRSVKVSLRAVFKDRVVYEDILTTSLAEIENAINSRPLTTLSADATDLDPLTPRHLLAPSSSFQVTQQDSLMPGDETCRRRWRQAQFIVEQFWRRWKREYLPNLTVAQKWRTENRSLKAGDVVIVVDDSLPRGSWPLGRVLETYAGRDGRVRTVSVKTRNGVFRRPACKLCFLEMS